MSVSMAEIARRLGVSRAAVSYVLNDRPGTFVGADTRDRILAAAREAGYSPNRLAQALVSGRTYFIEFWTGRVGPAYYSRAIHEFREQLRGSPYEMRIIDTEHRAPLAGTGAGPGVWPADGVVAFELYGSAATVRALHGPKVPFLVLGSQVPADTDHVQIDLFSAAQAAVRHLLQSGRRRVAYLAPGHEPGSSRGDGYRTVMADAGRAPIYVDVPSPAGISERAQARRAIRGVLRRRERPDALFCFNDEYAIGALRGLRDAGLRVPDDVAIVGCDGIEETEYHDPPLSTIRFPFAEAARLGWEFLHRRIDDPELPVQSAVLTPQLAVRGSSQAAGSRKTARAAASRRQAAAAS